MMRSKTITLCIVTITVLVSQASKPTLIYGGGVPVFGSIYAGKGGLDLNNSDIKPKIVLREPGALDGKWLQGVSAKLLVSLDNSGRHDFNSQKYCATWKMDCFLVRIQGTKVTPLPLTAAYEEFRIFAADITGDGTDEIIIESGEGRGTSVHVRSLKIYKIMNESFVPILEVPLNGYLTHGYDPQIKHADPLSWERIYYFKKNDNDNTIHFVLKLSGKPDNSHGVAELGDLFNIQAKEITFKYDANRHSYFLDKVIFGD